MRLPVLHTYRAMAERSRTRSTILNGALIGRGSLIAAGAVVKENMIVKHGSICTRHDLICC